MLSDTQAPHLTPAMRDLFEPAKLDIERAPVLRSIFERYAVKCAELFAELLLPPCNGVVQSLRTASLRELLDQHKGGLGAFYDAEGLDASVIIGFDRRLMFSLTEAIFGGDRTEPPYEGSRPFSNLEVTAAKAVFDASARELEQLFEDVLEISLVFTRLEPKLNFSSMGLPNSPVVMATVEIIINGSAGTIFIIVPQRALMPLRRKLEREHSPEPGQTDPQWSQSMMSGISLADVTLTLSMEGPALTLLDITRLKAGEVLRLSATIDSLHELSSDTKPLFRCRLGQSQGQFCAQITEVYDNDAGHPAGIAHDRFDTDFS